MTASEFKESSADLCQMCMTRAQYLLLALGSARALGEKNGRSWPLSRPEAEHLLDAVDRIFLLGTTGLRAATIAELAGIREKCRMVLQKKWPRTLGLPIR
jgi:hypothetical protein